ncbi:MAG: M28 family peptidase [Ignisphaera sp.]|uniref:M28 family peptidase n=1 Tax=Ignisphaera aggregans TaxID=334771 RepID=A0A7C4JJR0_9CREN
MMNIVYNAVKIASELASFSDVVAGNSGEKRVVENIRGLLEDDVDVVRVEPVEVLAWEEDFCVIYIDGVPYACSVHPPYEGYADIVVDRGGLVYLGSFDDVDKVVQGVEGRVVVIENVEDPNYIAFHAYKLRKYNPIAIVFIDKLNALRRIVAVDDIISRYNTLKPPLIPAIHVKRDVGLRFRKATNIRINLRSRLSSSYGFNVIAEINGRDSGTVYLAAHHDHWFSGVVDDVLGVSTLISFAKTNTLSSVTRGSIVLAFFTAEEGFPNPLSSFYWLVGSRHHVLNNADRILEEVPLVLNLDVVYRGRIRFSTSNLVARGFLIKSGINVDSIEHDSMLYDSFSFTMLGIPSITMHNYYEALNDGIYHSTLDDIELIKFIGAESLLNVLYNIVVLLKNSYIMTEPSQLRRILNLGIRTLTRDLALKVLPLEVTLELYKVLRRLEQCHDISKVQRVLPSIHRVITSTYIPKSVYEGTEIYEKTSYIICNDEVLHLPLGVSLNNDCYKNIIYDLESLTYILRC